MPLAIVLACAGNAHANALSDIIRNTRVDGSIRAYYFTRQFGPRATATKNNLRAFSLTARLNLTTAPFAGGFGFGATLLTAQSLGINNGPINNIDTTLMGARDQVTALGQLYLQYRRPWYMIRIGDQILNTPWMNSSDTRAMPASFQALYADITPIGHVQLYAIRQTAWKSRTSKSYFHNNLYYKSNWGGDDSHGGQPYTLPGSTPTTTQKSGGTLALGVAYNDMGIKAQFWYYDFYKFARTFYGDAKYTYDTGTGFDPFVGIQFLNQRQRNSMFSQYGVTANGLGGNVKSNVQGAIIGINIPHGVLSVAYDKVFYEAHSFGGGIIISPFTANYATDPLWTTSMIRGMVELGPGNSWKVKGSYKVLNDSIKLVAAYAAYKTKFKGNSNNIYFDATYFFSGSYKGLSLRNRFEISRGHAANGADRFVYNRVMMQYKF